DPELGINVVDLGLVYGVAVDQNNVATIDMTLPTAACPLSDVIGEQAVRALEGIVSGQLSSCVWMPPWGPERITDDGREQLRALVFNVCLFPRLPGREGDAPRRGIERVASGGPPLHPR